MGSPSAEDSLSYLRFLIIFAKGMFSFESASYSVSDSDACGGIDYAASLNCLLFSLLEICQSVTLAILCELWP